MTTPREEDYAGFLVICVIVAAIMLIWAALAATRAELIRPDNCAFLEEAIAIIEAREPRISEDELKTLLLLREWRRRSDCPEPVTQGCKAKDGEECL